ncbi:MAG: energy transducer TonB [Verrucomicrobiota bacterium]
MVSANWKTAFLISVAVHCAAIPLAFHYAGDGPKLGKGDVHLTLELFEEPVAKPSKPTPVSISQPEFFRETKPAVIEPKPEISKVEEIITPMKLAVAEALPSTTVPSKSSDIPTPQPNIEIPESFSPSVSPFAPVVVNAAPLYRENREPVYPSQARRKKQEGVVILIITVNTNGAPMKIEVKQGSGFSLLDYAAVEAVRRWQFEPAKIDKRPIVSSVEIPISFKLSK